MQKTRTPGLQTLPDGLEATLSDKATGRFEDLLRPSLARGDRSKGPASLRQFLRVYSPGVPLSSGVGLRLRDPAFLFGAAVQMTWRIRI